MKIFPNITSTAIAILLVMAVAIQVRGPEGLDRPPTADDNDAIVFAQISQNKGRFSNSIMPPFIESVDRILPGVMLSKRLLKAGVGPSIQYRWWLFLQLLAFSVGLYLIFRSFLDEKYTLALAVPLFFASVFFLFGRYISLGFYAKLVQSTLGLSFGFIVLVLFFLRRYKISVLLAALLVFLHPTHSLILLSIIFSYLVYAHWLRGFVSGRELISLTLIPVIPLGAIAYKIVSHPNIFIMTSEIEKLVWEFIRVKTSNLNPLDDGVLVVILILIAIGSALCLFLMHPDCRRDTSHERGAWVLGAVIVFWFVQLLFSEFVPVLSIAKLQLTRSTPYGAVLAIAAFVLYAKRDAGDGKNLSPWFVLACLAALLSHSFPEIHERLVAVRWTVIFHPRLSRQLDVALVLLISLLAILRIRFEGTNLNNILVKGSMAFPLSVLVLTVFMGLQWTHIFLMIAYLIAFTPAFRSSFPNYPLNPVVFAALMILLAESAEWYFPKYRPETYSAIIFLGSSYFLYCEDRKSKGNNISIGFPGAILLIAAYIYAVHYFDDIGGKFGVLLIVMVFGMSVSEKGPISLPFRRAAAVALALGIFLFLGTNEYKRRYTEYDIRGAGILEMVDKTVPKNGMVMVVPHGERRYFGSILPVRPTFLSSSESQYAGYFSSGIRTVKRRLNLMGVDYNKDVMDLRYCRGIQRIIRYMCIRSYYFDLVHRDNDIWRKNISRIKEETPNLSHVLMRRRFVCQDEIPDAVYGSEALERLWGGKFFLVPIEKIQKSGCKRL